MRKPAEQKDDLSIPTRAPDQLGVALGRFRELAALSQATLAQSAGLRQATVSKAERGAKNTEIGTLYALCAALGLELVLRPRGSAKDFRPEELF